MMCSNDEENEYIIGDVNDETVHNIWNGDALNKVRNIHLKQNGYKSIEVCKKCYLPREVESTEIASVNGKFFNILNYVNRKQHIGE